MNNKSLKKENMKTIGLKIYELEKKNEQDPDINTTSSLEMIQVAIAHKPIGKGTTSKDIETSMRLIDIFGDLSQDDLPKSIEMEDQDFKNLKNLIENMEWGFSPIFHIYKQQVKFLSDFQKEFEK